MVQPCDYKALADLFSEGYKTGMRMGFIDEGGNFQDACKHMLCVNKYILEPAPPQPKFRPMNDGELIQLARRGVIVEADYGDTVCIGTLQYIFAGNRALFTVCGRTINPEKIRYADTREPIQVEIKD